MTQQTYDGLTASELRQRAADKRQRAAESWERSDTDGFLSQWAATVSADLDDRNADTLDNGGWGTAVQLVDEDYEAVPARIIRTIHGHRWAVFATFEDCNGPTGDIIQWVGCGERAQAAKGYKAVRVARRGHWELKGSSYTGTTPVFVVDGPKVDPEAEVIEPLYEGT